MSPINEKIIELSAKWYEYVSKDHHKDRDCHWYIEVDYAYGEGPTYQAQHFGYIADAAAVEKEKPKRARLAHAQEDLYILMCELINAERRWVNLVLKQGEPTWDSTQAEKADLFVKLFGGDELSDPLTEQEDRHDDTIHKGA